MLVVALLGRGLVGLLAFDFNRSLVAFFGIIKIIDLVIKDYKCNKPV